MSASNISKSIYKVMAIICMIVFAISVILPSSSVHADDEQAYSIKEMDINLVVNKDHSYDIEKLFDINIPNDNMESLTIKIPTGHYMLTEMDVDGAEYSIGTEDEYRTITITTPELLTKGDHEYRVTYRIVEYADHNDSYDMFYINVLPPDWEMPIEEFRLSIEFPDDFDFDNLQYYAGQYGNWDVTDRLDYSFEGNTMVMVGSKIPADFGVTLKAEQRDGYWQDPLDNSWAGAMSWIITAIGTLLILLLWLIGGRDPKLPDSDERYPVDGVGPTDIGFIFSGVTRIKDVITLILYMAIGGYLRISEYEPKKYRLIKLEEPHEEERYIRSAYHMLFDDVYEGRAVDIADSGRRLREVLREISVDIESGYGSDHMAASTPRSGLFRMISVTVISLCIGSLPVLSNLYEYQNLSIFVPVAITVMCFITLELLTWSFDSWSETHSTETTLMILLFSIMYLIVVGYAVYILWEATGSVIALVMIPALAILSAIIICYMLARAEGNAKLVARLLSLRKFINDSEPGDVAKLLADDPDYYYTMLPYAYRFSLLDKWAKKFRWLNVGGAEWFIDEISGHVLINANRTPTTIDVARQIDDFARTIEIDVEGSRRDRVIVR